MPRKLYRLVGQAERDLVERAAAASRTIGMHDANSQVLVGQLANLAQRPDFGNVLQTHTMSPLGGGSIGGPQPLVSMFSDFDALASSTDDQVQNIVRNAPFVLTFEVPLESALDAPSDLSRGESEVVVPNDIQALPGMFVSAAANPFRTN